ncbi:MAG: 5-oxoprolinase subunit PxpB [Chloroflexota bacterium]
MKTHFRIEPFGECGVLVILGDEIDITINQQVHLLREWLDKVNTGGIKELIPAYASLLVEFDPFQVDYDVLQDWIIEGLDQTQATVFRPDKVVQIPTIYGGVYGPDLEFVAEYTQLSLQEVIRLHSEPEYVVFMMGFSPGFPYLGGMNSKIAVPRLASPRTKVPAGSVGIAGKQTGIYPRESPGGWRIIGRTPLRLFDPKNEPHILLKPGDRLQFIPVSNVIFDDD